MTDGTCTTQGFARFIAAAGLADEFDRRHLHRIAESERPRAVSLIHVQALRFCGLTLAMPSSPDLRLSAPGGPWRRAGCPSALARFLGANAA